MDVDYYGVLGLNRSSTDTDIKKSFRRLALKYHPERSSDPDSEDKFAAICEAYDVLSVPSRKAAFDQYGEKGLKSGLVLERKNYKPEEIFKPYTFHGNCDKVFREFFGVDNPFAEYFMPNIDFSSKFIGKDGKPRKYPGPCLEKELWVTLEQMFYGEELRPKVDIKRTNFAGKVVVEEKTFLIKLPRGCSEDRRFTFKNEGENMAANIIPGDLAFVVKQKPHPSFIRDGNDLIMKKEVTLDQAIIGFMVIEIITIDDKKFRCAIHDYIRQNHRKIIPNEGMPFENIPGRRGDLIIEFDVTIPYTLFEQKNVMKQNFK